MKKLGKQVNLKIEKLASFEGRQNFELSIENLGVSHLKITEHLTELDSKDNWKRLLLCETRCIVRLYMISAYDLASRDNGGESDPYLKVQLGNRKYNERDNYQLDQPNPFFFKRYDFETQFPGCPPLVIKAMDYDDVFGDDLIGKTSIDLEDRFFSGHWQSMK